MDKLLFLQLRQSGVAVAENEHDGVEEVGLS
jgi:hypothetical protein